MGSRKHVGDWSGKEVPAGSQRVVHLAVSESYSGISLRIPIFVHRATEPGPVVFVTAALHGDELNGTGAVRQLIQDDQLELRSGALILVPVLNLLAFERHSRYLPDRRDLNRCFPGSVSGSLASRMARTIFDEIVGRADYGIDLHTASVRRTNYPNVRGDLSDPKVEMLAESFGTDVIMNGRGPAGALRREACLAGCPTIIMEGGEVWKAEPRIVEIAVRGIRNVLAKLEMVDGDVELPEARFHIETAKWVRAEKGGFLQFHVGPGDFVEKDQPLATNTTLLGFERSVLISPFDGIVIGMTTLPAVSPGEPVFHLGRLPKGVKPKAVDRMRVSDDGLESRVVEDLASNLLVVEPSSDEPTE
ncbi:succinylglutamate desuccinylase/aspartoacylase family protein [Rhodopirellula sp. JC740]|uniref:Succinylglutamate desuccinylase/aspartoacylase family protein n=1 Tax=Rhodopirellula halodulae TaxID=2894198 RepID=A0ABS8NKE8_9BACT|nr:succinylglutamate desuccinylase/aspartoacylase family protein [Rhodopirellula sp. JC740]MCC9644035.1 succinylglutamate desuccinylase/aspartoacylase family protein [Rhodopirellula sp. JC740]